VVATKTVKNTLLTITLFAAAFAAFFTSCDNGGETPKGVYYTVDYNLNGGNGTTPASQSVRAGGSITLPGGNGLTKSGYAFDGWNTHTSGMGFNYKGGETYTPVATTTLYAKWAAYTVTFDLNGGDGEAPASQSVPAGGSITLPAGDGLTKSGFFFDGWKTVIYGVETNYPAGETFTPDGNITLYARWVTTYTIFFFANGGSGETLAAQEIIPGSSITLPDSGDLVKSGYAFDGWNTHYDGTGTDYAAGEIITPTGSMTLYAKWVVSEYTVCFLYDDGSGIVAPSQAVPAGGSITLPNGGDLARSGYLFGGWSTGIYGTGTNYPAGGVFTPTGDIIIIYLYVKWDTAATVSPNSIVYYWIDQHGSLVTSGSAAAVGPGEPLIITARGEGYDVYQWYLNSANTGEKGDTFNFSSTTRGKHIVGLIVRKDGNFYNTNITVTVDVYTVSFNLNGGSGTTPSPRTVNAGSNITLDIFSRSGYNFLGWTDNASGTGTVYKGGSVYTPTATVTLYARWSTGSGTEDDPYALTAGTWKHDSITSTYSGSAVWYSFNVVSGTTYYVWWNDKIDGSKTLIFNTPVKTLDVRVIGSYGDDGLYIFTRDSGYTNPEYFVANRNGMVKLKVTPYSTGATGTFAVAYKAASSTRP